MKISKQQIVWVTLMLVLVFSGCANSEINDNRDSISTEDAIIETTGIEDRTDDMIIEDTNIMTRTQVDDISSTFKESGYTVVCESAEQQILSGRRYLLTLSGVSDGRITLYEYDDFTQAQIDGFRIDESGSQVILASETGTEMTYIEWKSTPHFYQLNNFIIQYVGTDKTILSILTNLCGNQFAGGDITE